MNKKIIGVIIILLCLFGGIIYFVLTSPPELAEPDYYADVTLHVGNYTEYEYNFTGTYMGDMHGTIRAEVIAKPTPLNPFNYTMQVVYSPTDGTSGWTETDTYFVGKDFMCPLTWMGQATYVADDIIQTEVGMVNVTRYTTGVDDAIYVHKHARMLVLRILEGQTVIEITDTDIYWFAVD